jgi:2-polyprenyl-3-methyl-5-hydroxy-6-metoxy-1,4-benzoquinol methylase
MPSRHSCRACESPNMGLIGEERTAAESFELLKCLECSSISLFPDPKIDYTNHTSDDLAIKHYLELNASIEWMAVNVMSVIGDRRSGRLLDIGCGYGFSADVAKKLAGWHVVGVEPSNYGRRGARALKLNIIHEFIDERHPIARDRFDIIHASEVIEHIVDPGKFLVFLRSMLEHNGILVLTTPDASALGMSISHSQRQAILSIGAHVVLFTQDGLSTLLRRVGFGNVQIELRGATLVAFAGNGPIALTAVQPARLGLQYCGALLASPIDDDYLEAGIRYRYFRHLVELGEYEKAFRLVYLFDQTNDIAIKCTGSTEFTSKFRMFAGVLLFYLGILNLNFMRNIESARDNFLRSNAICAEKLRLFEETSVFDHNIMWRSLLHVAICDEQLGHPDRSKHIYEQILSANVGPDGNVPADILEAAKTAFTRLG